MIEAPAPAPGYGKLGFAAPEPGSYELGVLGAAGDGDVLSVENDPRRLHSLMGDRVAVLSFIYGSCHDVNGCPLANAVLRRVQQRLKNESDIVDQLRLLTLSFDPARDTPEAMKRHRDVLSGGEAQPEWHFLTTKSNAEITPILEAYGQAIVREPTEEGAEDAAPISHNLKVFLIDRQRQIRNVYGVSFLHPDTLVADIRTLLLAETESLPNPVASAGPNTEIGPGDLRDGYDTKRFVTRSRAVQHRRGAEVDLLKRAANPPLGLPKLVLSSDQALSEARVGLGRKLFFDRRLSANGTFSCAMCHIPEQGFTNNELATPIGFEGRTIRRNAPTLLNVGHRKRLLHDARVNDLEEQIWTPLLARNEMANVSEEAVLTLLAELPDYPQEFQNAFPEQGLTRETLGSALASYQRTLVSGDSPFDRMHFGSDQNALSPTAKQGLQLFQGKAGCVGCHSIGETSAALTDDLVHNTGVGAVVPDTSGPTQTVQVSPGVEVEVPRSIIASVSEPKPTDFGRYEITGAEEDRWKYKTPTLRNVALTAPYMHDGSLRTLEAVVEFYDRGGISNPGLDPRIRPLALTPDEKQALVAFLEALTSSDVKALVQDAVAAPIGDVN